jgi:hypothetical protein
VPTVPRFQIVTEFAAFEGWRNCLAVDRREVPPRPVVLSFVPARVADAPERLARLAEDVERAARLFHSGILRVIGMGTFADAPVVLQEWRDGESLRELLDTGTRMPPEVAARIVADAAEAVQHSHGRAVEQGRPFAHGALRAERVLIGIDGSVVVSGFGRAAEGDGAPPTPAEDVRALGTLLLQCLAGEQPSGAGLPGVPDKLAELAARAADEASSFASADAFHQALSTAVPLAERDRVRSWADGVLPPEAGTRGRRRRSLESALADSAPAPAVGPVKQPPRRSAPAPTPAPEEVAEDAIVAALTPIPGAMRTARRPPAPPPVAEAAQVADDLIVGEATGPMISPHREATPEIAFPRPAPPPSVAWNVVGATAGAALVAGFVLGFFLGR